MIKNTRFRVSHFLDPWPSPRDWVAFSKDSVYLLWNEIPDNYVLNYSVNVSDFYEKSNVTFP